MFEQVLNFIPAENLQVIKYGVLAVLAISILTTLVKKLFKLAITLALIGIAVYYILPVLS